MFLIGLACGGYDWSEIETMRHCPVKRNLELQLDTLSGMFATWSYPLRNSEALPLSSLTYSASSKLILALGYWYNSNPLRVHRP